MDQLDGAPCEVLGYHITTRTQICLTCCVSVVLELIVYVVLTIADIAVVIQHFRDANPLFAGLTLTFLWLPAVVCFCSVITSPWQWPSDGNEDDTIGEEFSSKHEFSCGRTECWFFLHQLFNMLAFPVTAVYR